MDYSIGQRWISDTEQNLGLGTIIAEDNRTVTLAFSASDENRVYAKKEAPITRIHFQVGNTVQHSEGWFFEVSAVIEEDNLLQYEGLRLPEQTSVIVREVMIAAQLSFNQPKEKLFAGQTESNKLFNLRYQTRIHQFVQHKNPLRGLLGVRADLISHQIYIAHHVNQRMAPRVLLADEVGLGKTIEAGMIIHQQLLTERAHRVLILLPESLQHQWLIEMKRRFNLNFSLFDQERCDAIHESNENPFESEQLILCSIDFLSENDTYAQCAQNSHWDLLVVDEAHHLEWKPDHHNNKYRLVEILSKQIESMLLLTATPNQLGQHGHFARLRLLDPDRFYSYDAFVKEQEQYAPVVAIIDALIKKQKLSVEHQKQLGQFLNHNELSPLLMRLNSADQAEQQQGQEQLINMLNDRHGTSRVLFRNTRANIKGFPKRTLYTYPLHFPDQYHKNTIDQTELLELDIDALYPEINYQREVELVTSALNKEIDLALDSSVQKNKKIVQWWQFDPRINWLIQFLKDNPNDKVLLICAHAQTAIALEKVMREKEGIRGAVFHEGMSVIERDRAAAYFAQNELTYKTHSMLDDDDIYSKDRFEPIDNSRFLDEDDEEDLDDDDYYDYKAEYDDDGEPYGEGFQEEKMPEPTETASVSKKRLLNLGFSSSATDKLMANLLEKVFKDEPEDVAQPIKPIGGAQILYCSEIGSEGRNFQFTNQLIMFDLPCEPDLLEQRIGRLDRIGQRRDIKIHVPYFKHSAQDRLFTWYQEGLNAFEQTCVTGRTLFSEFKSRLFYCLNQSQDTEKEFNRLLEETRLNHQLLSTVIEQGRDHLIELNSHDEKLATKLIHEISEEEGNDKLQEYANLLFDAMGVEQQEQDNFEQFLVASPQMTIPYPELPEEGVSVTFNREKALQREDLQFLTWEHPLIEQGMNMVIDEGLGMANLALLQNKKMPLGHVFIEQLWICEAQAPKSSGIYQFLPPTPIRMLIDINGHDLSEQVSFQVLSKQLHKIKRHLAQQMIKSLRPQLEVLLKKSTALMALKQQIVVNESQQKMQQQLGAELERMRSLQKVNPNIRQREIDLLAQKIQTLDGYMNEVQSRLDAVRIVVVTHSL